MRVLGAVSILLIVLAPSSASRAGSCPTGNVYSQCFPEGGFDPGSYATARVIKGPPGAGVCPVAVDVVEPACEPDQTSANAKATYAEVLAQGIVSLNSRSMWHRAVSKCPLADLQCGAGHCHCWGYVDTLSRYSCVFTNPDPANSWELQIGLTGDYFHDVPYGVFELFLGIEVDSSQECAFDSVTIFCTLPAGGRLELSHVEPLSAENIEIDIWASSKNLLGAAVTRTRSSLVLSGQGTPTRGCNENSPESCVSLECTLPDGTGTDTGEPVILAELDVDGDGVPNDVDNAPQIHNPDQADSDNDGVADVLDNCPFTPGANFPDADNDDWGDPCDCAPNDATVFLPPVEVQFVEMATGPLYTVAWEPIDQESGFGSTYDVLRGSTDEFPVGSGASETCLVSDTGCFAVEDEAIPAPGAAWWYLVRAENSCGSGTYGFDGSNVERNSAACP